MAQPAHLVGVLAASVLALGSLAEAQRPALFHAPLLLENLPGDLELLGDVDRDGDLDCIAFFSPSRNSIRTRFTVLLNDGSGNLTAGNSVNLPVNVGARLAYADVDGDGFGDVLVGKFQMGVQTGGILVYPGGANGTFGTPVTINLPGNIGHLRIGNLNRDNIADIFVLHHTGGGAEARWYAGDTQRRFNLARRSNVSNLLTVSSLAVVDTDADGVDDFAVAQGQFIAPGTISLFRTTSTGFTAGPVIATPVGYDSNLLAFDVDQDGDQDLVGTFGSYQRIDMFTALQGKSGAWQAGATQVFQNIGSGQFFAGDWDRDGRVDLVLRELESGTFGNYYHGNIYFRNAGAGRFQRSFSVTHRGDPTNNWGVGLVDLDRDNHLDFVDSRSLFFGDGTFDAPATYTTYYTAGDWDGDGDLDLRGDQLRINDGRGVFADRDPGFPSPPTGTIYGAPLAIADFDGDGLREALVAWTQIIFPRSYRFIEMRRLEEQPSGKFVDRGPAAAAGAQMADGVVTDADGDGDADFVDQAGVWVNDGAAFFTKTGPGFDNHRPIAVGDVDGNGTEDILASFTYRTGLAVFLRTGNATYTRTVLYQSTYNQVDLANGKLVDLDDDGDLDVIGRERLNFSQLRTVLFENQAGKFGAPVVLAPFGRYGVGDVNGDGRSDVVVGADLMTYVLLRKAVGLTYEAPVRFSVRGVRDLADIDQDGDLDLLGYYTTRNRRFEGPAAGLRRQYGVSVPGTGGRLPIASVVDPLRPGLTPSLWLRNAVGGGLAYILIGAKQSNTPSPVIPGVIRYTNPIVLVLPTVLSGAKGVPGAGASTIPVPLAASTAGATAFFQYVIADSGGQNGTSSHTNGVEVRIGR